jgi:small subunit ribosomal protein S6
MNNYEVIYIISPEVDEEGIKALVEKFKALIETEGAITQIDEWGRRRLAYPINDFNDGYYVFTKCAAPPTFVSELERILKITDGIIKYLIIRKE